MDIFERPRTVTDIRQCFFYHTYDLPGYGLVEGHWDLRGRFDEYIGHVPLSGRTVLDIGCASGFLSFEAEKRGAAVVSFDLDSAKRQSMLPFKDALYWRDLPASIQEREAFFNSQKNSYWLCHRTFNSKAKVHYGNIYDMKPELGMFDVVIAGMVLEHLGDQVKALESIGRHARDTIIITGCMLNTEERIARFMGDAGVPAQDYTFWQCSVGVYRQVLAMMGFRISSVISRDYLNLGRPTNAITVVAEKTAS